VEILFRTIHGSRLYGTADPISDFDYYTVIPNRDRRRTRYAKQTIQGNLDQTVIDFSTWRVYCDKGVPQALEAMFSPVPEVDLLADFRRAYRIDTAAVVGRYRRTIKSFSLRETTKLRRHALRLAVNLREAVETGRFNPVLSHHNAEEIYRVARLPDDDYFEALEWMTP
jgi:hypothetical protein